jgi:hypothetical protein
MMAPLIRMFNYPMFWLQLFGGIDGINVKLHARPLGCLFANPLENCRGFGHEVCGIEHCTVKGIVISNEITCFLSKARTINGK